MLSALLGLIAMWSTFHFVPLPERLSAPGSAQLQYRDGQPAHVFLASDDRWRIPADLENIDPDYISALLAIEDSRFYFHPGVDPISVLRATAQNLRAGRVISGASTITMQLVRVLEPRPRTFSSKIIETWRAMQLEWHLNKTEILSAYLTFIPFGRNIEGVEAATLSYFGHLPNHLEAHEISVLIAVPQNPTKRSPSTKNLSRLSASRNHIANLLKQKSALNIAPEESVEVSILNRIPPQILLPFPREITHLAQHLRPLIPAGARIKTTLDRNIQQHAKRLLQQRQSRMNTQGITNASVVVIDHQERELRALLGGFNYWDGHDGSQIPSFIVRRSAGSTLKPFLYASGIDKGLLLPSRVFEDIPVNFNGYQPRNYNDELNGLISIEDALSQSLNIPFVSLLRELRLISFLDTLSQAGIHSFRNEIDRLGLSAALGLELTPLELSAAYSTLASGGVYQPTTLFQQGLMDDELREKLERKVFGPQFKSTREVLSPAASWLTSTALKMRDRPDFPDRRSHVEKLPSIAWKTGTSFGFRDAWTAGWGAMHQVTIWFGNLDYTPSVHLLGSASAAPLLFDILEVIEDQPLPSTAPEDVIPVSVCSYSGLPPSNACPTTNTSFGRVDRIPAKVCPYHHHILVNVSGQRVTPSCTTETTEQRSVLLPSSSYLRWSKLPTELPEIADSCLQHNTLNQLALSIRAPSSNRIVFLLPDTPAEQQAIPLIAEFADTKAPLYWYDNGEFIGRATAQEQLIWVPSLGTHTLVVETSSGQRSSRLITVEHL